ncbi:MAG: peroxidase family protein, partial [Planctomycetota bacterium]|nr:peroxidase family protein [Planctomycetota bacterium]
MRKLTSSLFRWTVLPALCTVATAQFRSIDGSGNNPLHPEMGAANTPLVRLMGLAYEDGKSSPRMTGMPSARQVSNLIAAQFSSIRNEERASDMTWQWGQFLDHDIDLTEGAHPAERLDIPVPIGDPMFDPFHSGTQIIPLTRSKYSVDEAGVRQQMNGITAWIDGSNIYGSDQARANALRTLDGTGKLRVSPGNLLPFNTDGLLNAGGPNPGLFLAGDIRANEQSGLVAMHTLFVREHNYWAEQLASLGFSGNDTYELARWVVIAEIQAITYEEFLPVILGDDALPDYPGYDPTVDANISNVFSTVGYRFGHSMLSSELMRLDSD